MQSMLDTVDMHLSAKLDQNIPCGTKVMNIFIKLIMDGRTHMEIIVQTQGSCNQPFFIFFILHLLPNAVFTQV